MEEEQCLGLGFQASSSSGASVLNQDKKPASVADALMHRYVQKCLEYHHQQHVHEPQQTKFIPAQQPQIATNIANVTPDDQQVAHRMQEELQQQAVDNARAIAMKFHAMHQQQHQAAAPETSACHPPAPASQTYIPCAVPSVVSVSHNPAPSEFRAKRERYAEIEERRLRRATLKNFEYVARKDEDDMRRHAEELEQQKAIGANLALHAQRTFERRREAAEEERAEGGGRSLVGATSKSKSGIGTSDRKLIERRKRKEGHGGMSEARRDMSSAVYIAGLPLDGTVTDEEIRQLFGCFGTVRRVTMYTEKETGRLKGDGLVVYEKLRGSDPGELLGAVCSQLNGVELPCGSKITVEPADADYKSKANKGEAGLGSKNHSGHSRYGPAENTSTDGANVSSTHMTEVTPVDSAKKVNSEKKDDAGDDLDDFFASLT